MSSARVGETPASTSKRPYSLRLATEADADQVTSLVARIWTKNFGWSVPPRDLEIHLATALSVDTIRQAIGSSDSRFIVAVEEQPTANGSRDKETADGYSSAPTATIAPLAPSDVPIPTIVGVTQLILGPTEPCLTLPNPVELNRLYIEEAYQGSGLAASLVDEAGSVAKAAISARFNVSSAKSGDGAGEPCSLWLGVWEDNPRAVRFYEKMGFKMVGEHSFLVGENVRRDWVMEKPI